MWKTAHGQAARELRTAGQGENVWFQWRHSICEIFSQMWCVLLDYGLVVCVTLIALAWLILCILYYYVFVSKTLFSESLFDDVNGNDVHIYGEISCHAIESIYSNKMTLHWIVMCLLKFMALGRKIADNKCHRCTQNYCIMFEQTASQ